MDGAGADGKTEGTSGAGERTTQETTCEGEAETATEWMRRRHTNG
jgi:hypothetical protein